MLPLQCRVHLFCDTSRSSLPMGNRTKSEPRRKRDSTANLIPVANAEEARERGSNGGRVSGVARRKKASLKSAERQMPTPHRTFEPRAAPNPGRPLSSCIASFVTTLFEKRLTRAPWPPMQRLSCQAHCRPSLHLQTPYQSYPPRLPALRVHH